MLGTGLLTLLSFLRITEFRSRPMSNRTRSSAKPTPTQSPASCPPTPPPAEPLVLESTPRPAQPLQRALSSVAPVHTDHPQQDATAQTGMRSWRPSRVLSYTFGTDDEGEDFGSVDISRKAPTPNARKGSKPKGLNLPPATMEAINRAAHELLPDRHRTLVMGRLKELWRTILEQPPHTTFSNVTNLDLSNIDCHRWNAVPKPNYEEAVVKESIIRKKLDIPLMESYLNDALSCRNHKSETACRALIDFILVNVVAKLNSLVGNRSDMIGRDNPCMIVSEHTIQTENFPTVDGKTRSFSGIVDYLFAIMPRTATNSFKENASGVLENHAKLRSPEYVGRVNIIEAKTGELDSHLPQAATYCRKRGLMSFKAILSDGIHWLFFIYLRGEGDQHGYWTMPELNLLGKGSFARNLEVIACTLEHWITTSHMKETKYFIMEKAEASEEE
ncbi:hypothetical protein FRB94_000432 [Tulasnella sp. JGI-2019a]|nr:hypothetical protein FRB94_000432 [Tulasnella sp. JGI-2019a]